MMDCEMNNITDNNPSSYVDTIHI